MTFGINTAWTPAAIELFDQCMEKRMSFGDTAFELQMHGHNISRNACIGKARRMKISNGRNPGNQHGTTRAHPVAKQIVAPVCEEIAPPSPSRARSGKLIDLDADQCRWPMGQNLPFVFCTEDHVARTPYCAHHTARAFVR